MAHTHPAIRILVWLMGRGSCGDGASVLASHYRCLTCSQKLAYGPLGNGCTTGYTSRTRCALYNTPICAIANKAEQHVAGRHGRRSIIVDSLGKASGDGYHTEANVFERV